MDKKEIEKLLIEVQIEKQVEKRVRYHCVAFWSGVLAFGGFIGSFMSANSPAFKAAIKKFIEVWLST